MPKARLTVMLVATLGVVHFFAPGALCESRQEKPPSVSFFDVLDLPARIDEPKLAKVKDGYHLNCAVANRSNEPLLGLRLVLLIVNSDGKLRTRLNWSE